MPFEHDILFHSHFYSHRHKNNNNKKTNKQTKAQEAVLPEHCGNRAAQIGGNKEQAQSAESPLTRV